MLPSEILEDIFAYLSRDALDHCEIICLKWSKLIETSKRLSQRRIVSLLYNEHYPNQYNPRFWVELKSSTGKTIRIVDDPNQQELPAFRVFKNVIRVGTSYRTVTSNDTSYCTKISYAVF